MGYMEKFRLSGRMWAVWKKVGCVEYSGLCGIEWAIWNIVG